MNCPIATMNHVQNAAQQVEHPEPRDPAERNLEAARPVDAALARVGLDPRVDVRARLPGPTLVSAEEVRLCEVQQPLMAVALPGNLAVADDVLVEVWNRAPMRAR